MNRLGSRLFNCASAILAIGGLSTSPAVDAAALCTSNASASEPLHQSKKNDHRALMPNAARLCITDTTGSPWTASSRAATPDLVNIAGFASHDPHGDRDVTDPERRIMSFSGTSDTNANRTREADFNGSRKHDGVPKGIHLADRSEHHGRSSDSKKHARDWEDHLRHHKRRHHPHKEKDDGPAAAVPLPAAAVLFASGLVMLGFMRRRNSLGAKVV